MPAEKAKRHSLGIRTTETLKDTLHNAARLSGRSIAQEIEFRLEQSFDRDQTVAALVADQFGGEKNAYVLNAIASVARATAQKMNVDCWAHDPKAFDAVRKAWNQTLDQLTPWDHAEVAKEIHGLPTQERLFDAIGREKINADPELKQAYEAFISKVQQLLNASNEHPTLSELCKKLLARQSIPMATSKESLL